jgi:hypothetical protein
VPRFSERYGHIEAREGFQLEDADEALRSNVWNVIALNFIPEDAQFVTKGFKAFCQLLHDGFFRIPVDSIQDYVRDQRKDLKTFVFECPWYRLYDLIEFLVRPEIARYSQFGGDSLIAQLNSALENNQAGYRILDGIVVPITDAVELRAIDDALAIPAKYAPATEHIKTALGLFSERGNPDYRNAIKEAISAVESIARTVTGKDKAGAALDELAKSFNVHPALALAFKQIYGYTSDDDGIRHALLKDSDADAATAKYMIVACSAFVSYVVEKIATRSA